MPLKTGAAIGLLLRQAKEIGLAPDIFVCSGACDNPDVAAAAAGAADSLVIVASDSRTAAARRRLLSERFHEAPTSVVLRFFDATAVLRFAGTKCQAQAERRGMCIKQALESMRDLPGSSYPVNFDLNGDIVDAYQLKVVRDGQLAAARVAGGRVVAETDGN